MEIQKKPLAISCELLARRRCCARRAVSGETVNSERHHPLGRVREQNCGAIHAPKGQNCQNTTPPPARSALDFPRNLARPAAHDSPNFGPKNRVSRNRPRPKIQHPSAVTTYVKNQRMRVAPKFPKFAIRIWSWGDQPVRYNPPRFLGGCASVRRRDFT